MFPGDQIQMNEVDGAYGKYKGQEGAFIFLVG
jgi:hypothetical protein